MPPSWIFRLCKFGYSGVLIVWYVLCTNILVKISVIVTYASDIHLMTSRELTSGCDFWSHDHLRMAVVHLSIKFGADVFLQSGVIDIFLRN